VTRKARNPRGIPAVALALLVRPSTIATESSFLARK
jgi:hypothetical protein